MIRTRLWVTSAVGVHLATGKAALTRMKLVHTCHVRMHRKLCHIKSDVVTTLDMLSLLPLGVAPVQQI